MDSQPEQPARQDVFERRPSDGLRRLEAVVAALRGPGGCPWDREQTLATLKPFLLEETYELLEAIDRDDPAEHLEELGDVLLQIVLQTQLRREQNLFRLDDVAHAISEKLIRRHPHVFSDVKVRDAEEVLRNWEAIKRGEGKGSKPRGTLSGVPAALPALLRAQRVQQKCAKVGFDWAKPEEVRAKVDEELRELDEAIAAGDKAHAADELGDLLFAVASYARFHGLDAEDALRTAIDKFSRRFNVVERHANDEGVALKSLSVPELVERWKAAKQELRAKGDL